MHITQLPKPHLISRLISLGYSLGFRIFTDPVLETVLHKGQLPEKPTLQIKRLGPGREDAKATWPRPAVRARAVSPVGAAPLAPLHPPGQGLPSMRSAARLPTPGPVPLVPLPPPAASHFQDGRGWSRPGKEAPGGCLRGLCGSEDTLKPSLAAPLGLRERKGPATLLWGPRRTGQ